MDKITITTQITKTYDRKILRKEKKFLESQLEIQEPTQEELLELGKMTHPFYEPKEHIHSRLKEINEILKNGDNNK